MSLFEGAARVPLIVAGPGVRVGVRTTRPTSLTDIFPTALDIAGVSWPIDPLYALAGHSLVPDLVDVDVPAGRLLRASGPPHPDFAVTQ